MFTFSLSHFIAVLFCTNLLTLLTANLLNLGSLKTFINSASSFEEVEKLIFSGQMKGFLKTKEYLYLINLLKNDYSDLLQIEEIGKTHYDNPIFSVSFKLNSTGDSGILFTGVHHAREPVSLSMNLYVLLKILFELKMKNEDYEELVYTRNVFFVPLINVDGYEFNVILYESVDSNEFGYARKNRRKGNEFSSCEELGIGVDLNRNYGFRFKDSESSSSSNPCDETYRGPYAFSEPETMAVKNLIEKHPEIKIAFNYHSYGNFFLIPYSFLKEKSNEFLKENNNLIYKQIKEFEKQEIFPVNNKLGTTYNLLNYTSDGEASDWMLGEKGILAFSPELGNRDFNSESFYPDVPTAIDICRQNLPSAIYGIQKSAYSLKFNGVRSFNDNIRRSNFANNFNNDKNYFWAFCQDLYKNTSVKNLFENEFEILYPNGLLSTICSERNYNKFYSISDIIDNEGLRSFDYQAALKFSLLSKGVKRVIASLIKFDYAASTMTRLGEILDTQDEMERLNLDPKFLIASNKTNFQKNFMLDKIEPNNTIVLDFKLFTDEDSENNMNQFDFLLEFLYAIEGKNIRSRVINSLRIEDFQYFSVKKNIDNKSNLNNNSIQSLIALDNSELKSSAEQKHFFILAIALPILTLLVISIAIIMIVKKIKKKKLKEKQTENTIGKNKETLNNIIQIKVECKDAKDKFRYKGKTFPAALDEKAKIKEEISRNRLGRNSISSATEHCAPDSNERINTTSKMI